MKSIVALLSLSTAVLLANSSPLLDHNLAYRSPFVDHPRLGLDTRAIHQRHLRRQIVSTSTNIKDEHYPTYYGADFSNSRYIWKGGVNFTHNVASGDPWAHSVLLWTRAYPAGGQPDQSVPVCVKYSVFDNAALTGKSITSGAAFTSWDVDFTVKVEAKGLKADSKYWYQFSDCANPSTTSPIGASRTFATDSTPANQVNGGAPLKFAIFSCSNYPFGFFNSYGFAAKNLSADVFVHLGDYIYEYKNGAYGDGAPIGRAVSDRELATLTDYRARLAQYRTDESLLYSHQHAPWITIWDDHEVADNAWKAGTADSNDTMAGCSYSPSGTCFTDRKFNAVRAYHEWMPIRQVASDDKLRIWRNFKIGKLMDLTMLDTRQYDRDVTDVYYNTPYVGSLVDDPQRSIMGNKQESWFYKQLSDSKNRGALWRVVGQQIVFTQVSTQGLGRSSNFNYDQWDGYRANRNRVLSHLYDNHIDNTVILSGDSHANWVSDLAHPNDTKTYDPTTGKGAIGVEFGGTAVSSPSPFGHDIPPAAADAISKVLIANNPDLHWSEGSYRGFFTLSVSSKNVTASFYSTTNLNSTNLEAFNAATFVVLPGENKLSRPVAGGKVAAGVLQGNA